MLSLLSRNYKNNQKIFQIGSCQLYRWYSLGENNQEPRMQASLFSLARPIESILLRSRLITDQDAARLVAKTIALSTYSLALISLLGTFGLDTSPLLTGIGITGFTVGFAVKEVATNLLSGAMLVMGKVVKKGMWVRLLVAAMPGIEGKVESVDVRNVVLKTKEGSRIVVPSVILFTNPLIILPDNSDGTQGGHHRLSSSGNTQERSTETTEETGKDHLK
jgi:small conductance mechanosensitive channel